MGNVTNLSTAQVEKLQFDEGVVVLDYGLASERSLAPTRGGGEFVATITVRDVEFDGRVGKTAGMQIIEEQAASLKVTSLCMSQDEVALAFPGCRVTGEGDAAVIKNPTSGLIATTDYLTNVTMFGKLADGSYKSVTIYNAMHETGLTIKAVSKAEGEVALEFHAHYLTSALDGELWEIKELANFRSPLFVSAATDAAGTTLTITFNHAMSETGLDSSDYAATDDGSTATISDIALGSDTQTIELTLSAAVTKGKAVTIAYTKPQTGGTVNADGYALDTFTAKSVTNNKS